MLRKPQVKATLPDHILSEMDKCAKHIEITRSEYLANIAKWWYSQGCPPVNEHEAEFRKRHSARRAS
jgi:hypothetical protein